MKKILFILILVSLVLLSQAQTPIPPTSKYPIEQFIGADSTMVKSKGAFTSRIVVYSFSDTTSANLQRIKYYPGALIFTTDSSTLWLRNKTATKWLKLQAGDIDITSFTFDNDTTGIICFSSGVCDTFSIVNLTNTVNNIVQNFLDSSITQINDSTLIICTGQGASQVCDTIHLGSTNSYYFLSPDSLVTCDTVQFICTVPDSCYQQQLCDTIILSHPVTAPIHQNLLRPLPDAPNITEGGSAQGDARGGMYHNTWYYLNQYQLSLEGVGFGAPFNVKQNQWTQLSSSINEWGHYGAYQPTWGNLDENNQVKLRFNYTDPFIIPVAGALSGDSVGFMGNRYGYLLMTNSEGATNSYAIDDMNAKQVGIFFDTYSPNNEAITIFGNQVPSPYIFPGNNPTDTTLLDARIAVFKTNGQIQFNKYGAGTFTGTATYNLAVDANHNVIEVSPGGSQRFGVAGEDARATQTRYFSGAGNKDFEIDSVVNFILGYNGGSGFSIYNYATGVTTFRLNNVNGSQLFSPDGTNYTQILNGGINFTIGAGDSLSSTVLPYNSGARVVTMVQDTVTGRWYRQASSGGGGGFTTADNGVNASTPTNIQLGGQLIIATTTIDANDNEFIMNNANHIQLDAGSAFGYIELLANEEDGGNFIDANGVNGLNRIRANANTGSNSIQAGLLNQLVSHQNQILANTGSAPFNELTSEGTGAFLLIRASDDVTFGAILKTDTISGGNTTLQFTNASGFITTSLTATASLDFGNTAAGAATDLTISVSGAALGDVVSVGVPNGSVTSDNTSYWGWVSSAGVVTVRFNNNNLVSAVNPASGTFRVTVIKY